MLDGILERVKILESDLKKIDSEIPDILKKSEQSIYCISACLKQLKVFISQNKFPNQEDEIRQLFKEHNGEPSKKWLKSYEVRKILNISPGTLQNLRLNGTLPYTKIGGVMYYDYADIQEMLQSRKQQLSMFK